MNQQQKTIWGTTQCPTPIYFTCKNTNRIIKKGCGSWYCPVCAKAKTLKLRKRAINAALSVSIESGFARFLTLTLPTDYWNYDIKGDWNNLRTLLAREGYLKHYFWVLEFQDRGARHLHIAIWGRYIPWQVIKKHWKGAIHIEKRENTPIKYLMKYLGDYEKQSFFDKGERRYSSDRGFFPSRLRKIAISSWIVTGAWSEDYNDVAACYDQQINDIEQFKAKFKPVNIHPEYQKQL